MIIAGIRINNPKNPDIKLAQGEILSPKFILILLKKLPDNTINIIINAP